MDICHALPKMMVCKRYILSSSKEYIQSFDYLSKVYPGEDGFLTAMPNTHQMSPFKM